MSVFVSIPYDFDCYSFVVYLKSGQLIPPALFFFFRIVLPIHSLLCFHANLKCFCSSSAKNAIGILIGIVLNLQIAWVG